MRPSTRRETGLQSDKRGGIFIRLFSTDISFPCIHPSYTLTLYIINGLIALNKTRLTALLMSFWPYHRKWHRAPVLCVAVCVCVCVYGHVCVSFIHSRNANTPGVPELTATLSHILFKTWNTVATFAVSTHTLLTLSHNPNLTKEIHTSTVCVCVCRFDCVCVCVVTPTCATCSRGKDWVCFSDWGVSIQTYELIEARKEWWTEREKIQS